MRATRTLKTLSKAALRRTFEVGQRLGVDILPRHFYSEIPDIRLLRQRDDWKRPFSMVGVNGADPDEQLGFVQSLVSDDLRDALRPNAVHERACAENGEPGYGPVEADVLYAFVRTHKPAQILQIGCGVTTAICLAAAADAGYEVRITCIDPYPTDFLLRLEREGAITLVQERVEVLPPTIVEPLGAGDLFFVDSTHTLGPAGEVSRIILELLPRLGAGVWAHFHDISFPYDYDRNTLRGALVFPHESVLLHAFLAGNERFALRAALSMLHYAHPSPLGDLFPTYQPSGNDEGLETTPGHFPSAAYLEVVS